MAANVPGRQASMPFAAYIMSFYARSVNSFAPMRKRLWMETEERFIRGHPKGERTPHPRLVGGNLCFLLQRQADVIKAEQEPFATVRVDGEGRLPAAVVTDDALLQVDGERIARRGSVRRNSASTTSSSRTRGKRPFWKQLL